MSLEKCWHFSPINMICSGMIKAAGLVQILSLEQSHDLSVLFLT